MTYLAFLWVALWLAHAALAPVRSGKANRSNPMFITRATQEVVWDGSQTRFVFVQERGEFRLYKLLTAMIGAAAIGGSAALGADLSGLFVSTNLWETLLIATAILAGGVVGLFFIELAVRGLPVIDVAGHGAEIMAAQAALPAAEAAEYAARETRTVAAQYDILTDEAAVWINETQWLARIVYRLGK